MSNLKRNNVKIKVNRDQLLKTVNFIAENNIYFKNQHQHILQSIIESINVMVKCKDKFLGTMGYTIMADYPTSPTTVNQDIIIEILVDLNVGGNFDFIDLETVNLLT